ncbi:phasin (plasmid) [Novosphingobium pentaromativorans US6-1]|uniref:Phasin n=2 Tax=Novosphingobium pentaromativorans TaxID=205844 RepID=G6EH33_9SPHN|nr:phasin [Novosphingobium pentaromativorans US6-1]EHJ59322.1 phasin [Novosphingobium pentaromativorans US6-1]
MTKTNAEKIPFDAINDKAKIAIQKGASAFGAYGELAKANVSAFFEAGKIFAEGLQKLGTSYSEDNRASFENLSEGLKSMAAATSPAEFYKLQSEFLRRNVEAAIARGSKSNDALVKLTKAAAAPLAKQVDLNMQTIQKIA